MLQRGGGAVGVVLALRAAGLVDPGGHQLVDDAERDADREREQALAGRAGELAEDELDGFGQALHRLFGSGDLRCVYASHGGSSCPHRTWFGRPERSQPERTRREDRRSKNEKWDYLREDARSTEANWLYGPGFPIMS